jgi:3-methyladenine DNA glycosylase AlkD
MTDENTLKEKLKSQLAEIADDQKKLWWENYVKHDTKFRGVGIPDIREKLKEWYQNESVDKLPLNKQLDLALSFFAEEYSEDKIVGILFLQIYLYDKFDYRVLLPKFEKIFKKKYIYDWNICDWFCVRVLGAMIKQNGLPCAKAITKWNTAKNVWQARCSVVAFANLAKENKYTSLLLESSQKLITREERFAKTAVGWILREISKTDEKIVVDFIVEYKNHFSKESLENSIKYFDINEKKKMRELLV